MGESAYFCVLCCNYEGIWVLISYTESYQPSMDLKGIPSYLNRVSQIISEQITSI